MKTIIITMLITLSAMGASNSNSNELNEQTLTSTTIEAKVS